MYWLVEEARRFFNFCLVETQMYSNKCNSREWRFIWCTRSFVFDAYNLPH